MFLIPNAGLLLAAAVVGTALIRVLYQHRKRPRKIRGTTMQAKELPDRYWKPSEQHCYLWGNRWLTPKDASYHFVTVGSTGSGKTVNVLLLLKHVLRRLANPGNGMRALVYDSKTDLLSVVAKMMEGAVGKEIDPVAFVHERLRILNPFDARCYAWDMGRDITEASEADDVAAVLVPEEPGSSNPFFARTAQRLLEGIITAFIENAGDRWTLRDVILASKSKDRLAAIYKSSGETEDLLDFFSPDDTFNDVKSTLDSHLRGYRPIAAAWEEARAVGRCFSIQDWMKSEQVFVLGNSTRKKSAIGRVNQLLFTELTKVLLDRPEEGVDADTWFFLDELSDLGKLATLPDLMGRGRGKGAACVLGFQDIGDIDATYGKDRARALVGNAASVAFLHINSIQTETQKWASESLGETQFSRTTRGESNQQSLNPGQYGYQWSSSRSENLSEQVVTERAWLPSQFGTDLPPTSATNGMKGLYRVCARWFTQHYPADTLFRDESKHNFVPRGDKEAFPNEVKWPEAPKLQDWDADDVQRLGIPGLANVIKVKGSGDDGGEKKRHRIWRAGR